jgi:hypothetical protein
MLTHSSLSLSCKVDDGAHVFFMTVSHLYAVATVCHFPARWMMVLTCVARLFPHLNCVILLVGNRFPSAAFQQRMEAMAITGMKLQVRDLFDLYAAASVNVAAAAAWVHISSTWRPLQQQA